MKYHELIQLYFERSAALQSLWTLYVVILGGVLAFSSLRQRRDRLTTALITVLFVIFALRNLGGIHDVIGHRQAAFQAIKQYPLTAGPEEGALPPAQRQALESTLAPVEFAEARRFHLLADLLTIAALWAMERRRKLIHGETAASIIPGSVPVAPVPAPVA